MCLRLNFQRNALTLLGPALYFFPKKKNYDSELVPRTTFCHIHIVHGRAGEIQDAHLHGMKKMFFSQSLFPVTTKIQNTLIGAEFFLDFNDQSVVDSLICSATKSVQLFHV